jgi:hypothetical protein
VGGFIWLRMWTDSGLLRTRYWTTGFHNSGEFLFQLLKKYFAQQSQSVSPQPKHVTGTSSAASTYCGLAHFTKLRVGSTCENCNWQCQGDPKQERLNYLRASAVLRLIYRSLFSKRPQYLTAKAHTDGMHIFHTRSLWLCKTHGSHLINPLTPELNPSAQRCLTRFLLGILLLEPAFR